MDLFIYLLRIKFHKTNVVSLLTADLYFPFDLHLPLFLLFGNSLQPIIFNDQFRISEALLFVSLSFSLLFFCVCVCCCLCCVPSPFLHY